MARFVPLYPLRFAPIYEYRVWGGRRLEDLLTAPLPEAGSIGEAWLLSDRDDHPSIVADGPLGGWPISALMKEAPEQTLGSRLGPFSRFPLLLKFLDAHDRLSVQVHPSDADRRYIPAGESGKTEAWVVLEAGTESRIYPGLKPDTTADDLRAAIAAGTVEEHLESFTPQPGDVIFIPAGTVHCLGGDVVVFELQQNSDVTFRLYDWGRTDPKTGRPRELQIDEALACIDFTNGAAGPVVPVEESRTPVLRERLLECGYFGLWRIRGGSPFSVGAPGVPRILVCIEGNGEIDHGGTTYPVARGDVLLLPAEVGSCGFRPMPEAGVLEISIPEGRSRR